MSEQPTEATTSGNASRKARKRKDSAKKESDETVVATVPGDDLEDDPSLINDPDPTLPHGVANRYTS